MSILLLNITFFYINNLEHQSYKNAYGFCFVFLNYTSCQKIGHCLLLRLLSIYLNSL